jgi:uncharacterized protein (TIGR03437 family)
MSFSRLAGVFACALFALPCIGGSGGPALFFSDLDWGPKTGWEGSATRGAAVTLWGRNLGSSRGTSYVTVNGARLAAAGDYAEWGAIGPARGTERITFWIPSAAADGTGNITVTVNGQTSNALPFTVMAGTIYFISTAGNNASNGRYTTSTGGSNGPWRDIYMFNPGTDSSSPSTNPSGDGQYIVYVRGGTYSTLDADGAFVALRGPYGGPTRRKALIGYPGETVVLNTLGAQRGMVWNANYSPYGMNSYFTFAKMQAVGGTTGVDSYGNYNRVVGMTFKDMLAEAWSGVVMVDNSQYTRVYGNLFDHNGFDSYKHNVYIKTHSYAGSAEYTYVGWNEFANAYARDTHGGVIFISKESGFSDKYTRYVYIHDNYFRDGNMEFIYTGDNTPLSDIYIYNNVFRGGPAIGGNGIFLAWHTNSVYLYNNVFYQMGGTNQAMVGLTGTTHAYFRNNIWVPRSGQPMLDIETYQGGTFNSDSDLFFGTVPSGGGITVTNPVTGDPRFVSTAGDDFRLQPSSPAINRGTSTVNTVVTKDYYGIPRPQGGAFDIGAFEYEETHTSGPGVTSVLNAASLLPTAVTPGALVTGFGSNLGPDEPVIPETPDSMVTELAGTRMLFDNTPAPLVSVQAGQVTAIVPREVAGKSEVRIEIEAGGQRSGALVLPVARTAPGLFTVDYSGRGQGVILNENDTLNSPSQPATRGSMIILHATGLDETDPAAAPIGVRIGGVDADIMSTTAMTGSMHGVFRIAVRIREETPAGEAVPLELRAGDVVSQPDVTLTIR